MLTEKDNADLALRGKTVEETEAQLARIAKGFAPADLVRAATVGDGIYRFSDSEASRLSRSYDDALGAGISVAKFVPASGAASRMFKPLHQYLAASADERKKLEGEEPWATFFKDMKKFAFDDDLERLAPKDNADRVAKILGEEGLGYGTYPKGLVLFHSYADGSRRTAAEEHLMEAEAYCLSKGRAEVHYTVPVGMEEAFRKVLKPMLEKNGSKINVSFSVQPPSTDVPALTLDGQPARDDSGKLILRPGGHGALIGNLGAIDADAVFVKNIDNVAHGRLLDEGAGWKKVIAGFALQMKKNIDNLLTRLDANDPKAMEESLQFIRKELKIETPMGFDSRPYYMQRMFVMEILDRPLRVCGMVKNEGEPGGGPYWVRDKKGVASLQIVESAQMDLKNEEIVKMMQGSTHFNPVDLFCCVKDRKGKKYDLSKFIDNDACFTTQKSVKGKDVIGMELPGLWNGAMAKWLTFFVEVPVVTFNPVKTVMDLLRPVHQDA